jgi:XTP/dITP diphosphohydrolase
MEPRSTVRLVMASANPDKVAEIEVVLRSSLPELDLVPRPTSVADVVEDADTLLGNARLKAEALRNATGLAAVADDTGLFVDALGGAPGVWSARFAGPDATYDDNCAKLLSDLDSVGAHSIRHRGASFRTVAIVAWPDGSETWTEGVVDGSIATERRGVGGFGYDPVFVPDIDGSPGVMTFAELGVDIKNLLSHRARAFRRLAELLAARRTP